MNRARPLPARHGARMRAILRPLARGAARLRSLPARRPWHVAMAALAAGLALAPAARPVAVAAAGGLPAGLALVSAGPLAAAVAALAILGGAAAGQARLRSIDAPARLVHDGTRLEARPPLPARPRPSPFGSSAEVDVVGGRFAGARLLARASRWLRWPDGGAPGTGVLLRGTLRRPRPPRAGGFDEVAYLRRRGGAGELVLDGASSSGS